MRVDCRQGELVWRLCLGPGPSGHVSLDPDGIAALAASVAGAAASGARALVIESEGPEFCAGMDLEGALALDADGVRAALASYAGCLEQLRRGPLATIAVVERPASGGGVGLAAACDLVIAGQGATFVLPELRFGLLPAVILPALRTRLRLQQVRRLTLTGEAIGAAQAEAWGLVDVLAADPAASLAGVLRGLARARPQALAALKRWSEDEAVDGPARTAADLADPELRAALSALLLEGAAPPWFSRMRGQG